MIRVLVVDDHAVVRHGMKQILADAGIASIGEASSAQEALDRLAAEHWDVVVLDVGLPDRNGLDVLRDIKALHPRLPVLVLTVFGEEPYAARALKAGAAGFLTKECLPEDLVHSVRELSQGRRYLSPRLACNLAFRLGSPPEPYGHEHLSDREFQVLSMLASGKRMTDAAATLGLSIKTVSTYRTRILTKIGVRTTADLIQYAIRHGLVR
jgi:DNA-binding NarL/FixJ family response regulator